MEQRQTPSRRTRHTIHVVQDMTLASNGKNCRNYNKSLAEEEASPAKNFAIALFPFFLSF